MGNHATALAKHKIQLAQVHLRAALEALRDGNTAVVQKEIDLAVSEANDAHRLAE